MRINTSNIGTHLISYNTNIWVNFSNRKWGFMFFKNKKVIKSF